MDVDQAIKSGARALFGEKYGDEVRVVSMGSGHRHAFSVELCGGTHVRRTGDIGLVSIVGRSAVAAGVQRLEAMTATGARRRLNTELRVLRDLSGLLRAPVEDAAERLAALLEERKKLERELTDARKRLAMSGGVAAEQPVKEIGGIKFFSRAVTGVEMKDLKSLADEAKQSVGSGVVAIVGVSEDGRAGVVVAVTPDLTARFQRGRFCPRRLGKAGRQGRRRPSRHGAGRRPRRRGGRRRAGRCGSGHGAARRGVRRGRTHPAVIARPCADKPGHDDMELRRLGITSAIVEPGGA